MVSNYGDSRPLIDYALIGEAVAYYTGLGYKQVEVPWIVDRHTTITTLPVEKLDRAYEVVGEGYLVGSAEQGFLNARLPMGRYVSVSPCFRHEKKLDHFHYFDFMKVELYQTSVISDDAVEEMVQDALAFMSRHHDGLDVRRTPDDELEHDSCEINFDIETRHGVELGSYGRRWWAGSSWLYGTGLALPRFTVVEDHDYRVA